MQPGDREQGQVGLWAAHDPKTFEASRVLPSRRSALVDGVEAEHQQLVNAVYAGIGGGGLAPHMLKALIEHAR